MSTKTSVSVMDQFVDTSMPSHDETVCSGLAHVGLSPVDMPENTTTDAADTVTLLERSVTGLLLLRATDSADELSKALQLRCGIELSKRLGSNTNEHYCVRWMSPDSWLLSCPLDEAFAIENALRDGVSGHLAIVNISGGNCILELSGPHARDVLMKSTGYDTHPDHFPAGKVVNTTFAKSQLTLRCVDYSKGAGRYELIVRRSFADYTWLWLQRAAAEYGLRGMALT